MRKPEEIHSRFVAAFNSGNVDALMALYEPNATFVPQPGQAVQGQDAIRQALLQFVAVKGTLELRDVFTVHGHGIALVRGEWKLTGAGPDGKPIEMTGKSVEVLRQQPNGEWLYAVDHPFGAD